MFTGDADDNKNYLQVTEKIYILEKRENAVYQHFLLFQECFQMCMFMVNFCLKGFKSIQ